MAQVLPFLSLTDVHLDVEFIMVIVLRLFGKDVYQTYARITGNQGFAQIFLGPFLALNTGK